MKNSSRKSLDPDGRSIKDLKFDHYLAITDETGILQHSRFAIPDRRLGYTTDDNTRALIVATRQYNSKPEKKWLDLASEFLAFLIGMQIPDGRFHNFMSYARETIDDLDSGDQLGRSLWATGCVINSLLPDGVRASAKEAFDKALPWALRSRSPRVIAHAIKGLTKYVTRFEKDLNAVKNLSNLVNHLANQYRRNRSDDWNWFEDILTYENWRLSECLFEAYLVGEGSLETADESLRFLIDVEFENGMLIPVGCEGWYTRNGTKARFDQLPVEAGSAVETLIIAAKATGSSKYRERAIQALEWFYGNNIMNARIYDDETGACFDGITETGLNLNKGSESTLSYLLAVTLLQEIAHDKSYF